VKRDGGGKGAACFFIAVLQLRSTERGRERERERERERAVFGYQADDIAAPLDPSLRARI